MKEDLKQFSDILIGISFFTLLFGLALIFSNLEIPFFPSEIFLLGSLGLFSVAFIIKFIYKNHEHL